MAKKRISADDMVAAALRRAAVDGWRRLSLLAVAKEAEISLADAYALIPSKSVLLEAIIGAVDRRVLAAGPAADGETPRDRVFEVLMRRFDALQEHRAGYVAILNDVLFDPFVLAPALPAFARSMTWMLETAAIPTDGPLGNLRTKGLAALYLNTLRTWRTDDSVDLARTMAALDRGLQQVEQLIERCPRLAGVPSAAAPHARPDATDAAESGTVANGSPSDV